MAFSERIASILEYYHISPKELAEITGVQRSAISHIINGRNKPSVSFITNLTKAFPKLSTNWLLHGKGDIEQERGLITNVTEEKSMSTELNVTNVSDVNSVFESPESIYSGEEEQAEYRTKYRGAYQDLSSEKKGKKKLVRIICLYDDGSFESFDQE